MSSEEMPSRSSSPLMDTPGSSSCLSWSSSDDTTSSFSSSSSKGKRANASYYLRGKARAPLKSPSLGKSLSPQAPPPATAAQQRRLSACSDCAKVLYTLIPAFQAAGMHDLSLHNRHLSHSTPKKARTRQQRNIKGKNEWILSTVSSLKICHP